MDEPPKNLNDNILDKKSKLLIITISSFSGILCLAVFHYFWQNGNEMLGRTYVFAVLGVQELIYIFSYRSLHTSVFAYGKFLANKALIGSVILGFSQIILGLYVPGLNLILDTVPLDLNGWWVVLGISFLMMFIVEMVKMLDNKIRGTPLKRVFKVLKQVQTKLPEINNLHNISVDIMKDKIMLQFHFDTPAETPLEAAHEFASRIEEKIEEEFPVNIRRNLEIISHIEPARAPPAKVHSHAIRPISTELRKRIETAIARVPDVLGWNHLRVMEEGDDVSISLTAYLDRTTNVSIAHHLTEEIEAEVRKQVPHLKRCVIHAEPKLHIEAKH